jgi:hypothetical protein
MGIMRNIIEWCDNKMNQAYEEDDERRAYGKAFLSGAVEGACDAAVLMYVPVLIACYVYKAKLEKQ